MTKIAIHYLKKIALIYMWFLFLPLAYTFKIFAFIASYFSNLLSIINKKISNF
jgi:hypothetical protein